MQKRTGTPRHYISALICAGLLSLAWAYPSLAARENILSKSQVDETLENKKQGPVEDLKAEIRSVSADGTAVIRLSFPVLPEDARELYLFYSTDRIKYTKAYWKEGDENGHVTENENFLEQHYIEKRGDIQYLTYYYDSQFDDVWLKIQVIGSSMEGMSNVVKCTIETSDISGNFEQVWEADDEICIDEWNGNNSGSSFGGYTGGGSSLGTQTGEESGESETEKSGWPVIFFSDKKNQAGTSGNSGKKAVDDEPALPKSEKAEEPGGEEVKSQKDPQLKTEIETEAAEEIAGTEETEETEETQEEAYLEVQPESMPEQIGESDHIEKQESKMELNTILVFGGAVVIGVIVGSYIKRRKK